MTCSAAIARKWDDPIVPGAANLYEVDFSWACARKWESREWALTDTIRLPNGLDAVCVGAGRSGWRPPPWPDVAGRTVMDGGVKWQIVHSSSASLETTVDTFSWASPAGITESGGEDGATRTIRLLTVSENVEAGDHTIVITATCANSSIRKQPCVLRVMEASV